MGVKEAAILIIICLLPAVSRPGTGDEGGKVRPAETKPAPRAVPSICIMDHGKKQVPRMICFMLEFNRGLDTAYLGCLLRTYVSECTLEGVNHDVAVVQMCLETGFLRFNGSVSRFQNNFCGLGATDPLSAGDWFNSMEEGIRAHIQHLKAYASVEPLNSPPVDKRFQHVKQRGTVFTIYDLAGRWATDPAYGEKLDWLLRRMYKDL